MLVGLVVATNGGWLLISSYREICANTDHRPYCKTCLLRLLSWMKSWFIKYGVDHFHERQHISSRLAFRERVLNHTTIFFLALSSLTSIEFLTSLPVFGDNRRLCRMSC